MDYEPLKHACYNEKNMDAKVRKNHPGSKFERGRGKLVNLLSFLFLICQLE